jgi:hypothetical protein
METKTAQNGFGYFRALSNEIHPQHTSPVTDEARKFSRGDVGADRLARGVKEGTDHEISKTEGYFRNYGSKINNLKVKVDNIKIMLDKIKKRYIISLEIRQKTLIS